MKKYLILFLLAFVGFSFVQKKTKYNSTNLKRRVIIDIPEGFIRLSDEDVITKYGMDKLPLAMFEDETGEVSVSVTEKVDSLRSKSITYKTEEEKQSVARDLKIEKSFLVSSYRNLYDEMVVLTDTVMEVNGVPMAFLEYDSKLSGKNSKDEDVVTEQYNYICYGYRKNRNYIINFACPTYKRDEWKERASEIIASVKF